MAIRVPHLAKPQNVVCHCRRTAEKTENNNRQCLEKQKSKQWKFKQKQKAM